MSLQAPTPPVKYATGLFITHDFRVFVRTVELANGKEVI